MMDENKENTDNQSDQHGVEDKGSHHVKNDDGGHKHSNTDQNVKHEEHIVKRGFIAEGTHCNSCEQIIKRQALKVHGVKSAEFDRSTEIGYVSYDENKTNLDIILSKIEEKGYECFILDENGPAVPHKDKKSKMGWVFAAIGIVIAGFFLLKLSDTIAMPEISANMGYGLLFLVGLLTGFHCVSMCGGFVLSYTAKDAEAGRKSYKSHLLYASGKTISYTVIGAAFGLLGSIIAFTPQLRGTVGIISGIFLLLFGLSMLNVFPTLRKVRIKLPGFVNRFVGSEAHNSKSPLVIGLLNGLMIACGPLQAVYIMAAGTGSWVEGAKLLFVFALGTLPVMLSFGYVTSFISSKLTHKILKASGVIIIILGLFMINNGLALSGSGYDFGSIVKNSGGTSDFSEETPGGEAAGNIAVQKDGYQEIRMDVTSRGWSPDTFLLKKGVPVRWIITGKEINGCNNAIVVPKYNLNFPIKPGEQTIEFTPTESGNIPWSCWMGMIRGTFIVQDDIGNTAELESQSANKKASGSASCGMGGGCGCGM